MMNNNIVHDERPRDNSVSNLLYFSNESITIIKAKTQPRPVETKPDYQQKK